MLLVGTAAVIGVAVLTSLLLALMRTTPVTVIIDGQAFPSETRAVDVAGLLDELELSLSQGDRVAPSPNTPIQPNLVIRIDRARSVFLVVDGVTTPLWTTLTNPAEILEGQGISVSDDDLILVDGTPSTAGDLPLWPVPVTYLSVRHAVDLRVEDDGTPRVINTTAETVGDALFEAGITVYVSDTISPELNAPVTPNLTVSITRARPVTIIADGETIRTRGRGETVDDVLSEAGIALVGLDYTIPRETAPLRPGMSIRVIRVREEIETTETELPYETVYQADPELEIDQRRVIQQGQRGAQTTRTRVRYENGIEIERAEAETIITREPVNHVVGYGTNVVVRTIETPQGTLSYWRKLRMYATSYHPAALGGDNITATGQVLQHGIVGADTRILPFGTEIYVRNYGVGTIADTGARRRDPLWVDLGYSDADWRSWSGYVDVYILTPVPEEIDYFVTD